MYLYVKDAFFYQLDLPCTSVSYDAPLAGKLISNLRKHEVDKKK